MKKIEYILLLIILVASFWLRLYKIDNPIADWHSWRQVDTASVTRIYLKEGIDLLHPKYYDISSAQTGIPNPEGLRFVEFPLYNVFHLITYLTFQRLDSYINLGSNLFEVAGRSVSIFFSLVSVVIIYLISRKLLGIKEGLISAALFALLPYSVFYSRTILPETMAVCLGLTALLFFTKYIDTKHMKWFYLSAISFAVSILTKPFTIFYSIPLMFLAANEYKIFESFEILPKLKQKKLWMYVFLVLFPFFLWRVWMSQYPEGIPHTSWAFNGDSIRFRPSFWRWIVGERLGILILGIGGTLPFAYGVLTSGRKHLFFLSFLFGVFLFVSVFATANVRHDYYQVITLPAIVFVTALGSVNLWNHKNTIRARLILIFCYALMFVVSSNEIKGYYQINNYALTQVRSFESENVLVIAPYNKDTTLLYHTRSRGWPYVEGSIDELIKKGAKYYISTNYGDPDTIDAMNRFEIIEEKDGYVVVKLYSH